jgi:hypothetical protein
LNIFILVSNLVDSLPSYKILDWKNFEGYNIIVY